MLCPAQTLHAEGYGWEVQACSAHTGEYLRILGQGADYVRIIDTASTSRRT